MEKELKEFYIERKIRGVQILCVEARNKKHARELVIKNDPSVEGIDFNVDYYSKQMTILSR